MTGYSYMDKAGKMLPDIPVTRDTREIIAYYPNGKVSTRFQIKDGIYEGSYKSYYNTGTPLRETEFIKDQNQGIEKNYYPNGKLREVSNYLNDERSGAITRYYENGTIKMTGYYLADKRSGLWHFYTNTGKETETVQMYNDDVLHVVSR
jgi:antitoxin component YwqK of YwqJK toxin-antitoxin module